MSNYAKNILSGAERLRNVARVLTAAIFAAAVIACSGNKVTMCIGTYTGWGSEGIYVSEFSQDNGKVTAPLNCGAVFSIADDGSLTKKGYQDTGLHPRNLAITPNGKYLLAACKDSGGIQVFKINKLTGELTYIPNDIIIDRPVCVVFTK